MEKLANISQFESLMNSQKRVSGNSVFNVVNPFVLDLPEDEQIIARAIPNEYMEPITYGDTYDTYRKRLLGSQGYRLTQFKDQLPESDRAILDKLWSFPTIEPNDTVETWHDKLTKDVGFKRRKFRQQLSSSDKDILYEMPSRYIPDVDYDDTFETWKEKLQQTPRYKRELFRGQLTEEDRDILATIYYNPEIDNNILEVKPEDTLETWYQRVVAYPEFKKRKFINLLPLRDRSIAEYVCPRNFPNPEEDDTFETWHKKLMAEPRFKKWKYLSRLSERDKEIMSYTDFPECRKEDTYKSWYERWTNTDRYKELKEELYPKRQEASTNV